MTKGIQLIPLIPGIKNPEYWYPERPSQSDWRRIRKAVLERDKGRCRYCGHKGESHMHAHHLRAGDDDRLSNLVTCCGPCHVVQHIGLNLSFGLIEIWEGRVSQVTIIRETRKRVKKGMSLRAIKRYLVSRYGLKKGVYPVRSVEYANMLIPNRKSKAFSFSLPTRYKVIFIGIKRWNIEP